MITIVGDKNDIKEIVDFMYEKNQLIQHHIGYCGTGRKELLEAVSNLIGEGNEFWVAKKDGLVVGVIGYEKYNDIIELWGPFIENEYNEVLLEKLWDTFRKSHERKTYKINIFCNQANKCIRAFADKKGFEEKSRQSIMIRNLKERDKKKNDTRSIDPDCYKSFIILHEHLFPKSLYSGNEILEMLGNQYELLVLENNQSIIGYTFLFYDKKFKEGTIEFIAVNEKNRGQGYGEKLLEAAFDYFYNQGIDQLQLSVDHHNPIALNLYQKMGFVVIHEMIHYTQKVNLKH